MSSPSRLYSLSLAIQRFVIAGWVGAAALFVITSVAEQTSPQFGSVVRDQLATIRFPFYYKFGFIVHILAAGFGFLAWRSANDTHRRRSLIVLALVMVSSLLIWLDFRYVYQPLQELINPPGQVRTPDFVKLHTWSKHANEVHVTVIAIAGLIAAWPLKSAPAATTTES